MMRPLGVCLSLCLLLAPLAGASQSTQTGKEQKPAQPPAVSGSGGSSSHAAPTRPTAHHHSRRGHSTAAARKHGMRPEYRPEYKENSVEVINGDATNKVVFHDEQTATANAKRLPKEMKNAPAPMKVEVVNGTSTDTRYFYDNGQDQNAARARNERVVVGVQSSDTRIAGGNKHPVVTGITSDGAGDAKSASSGGTPVTQSVSPRPKRPAYQPDAPH